jgi:adenine phosphoribosyltransferase
MQKMAVAELEHAIRNIPNFPKPGILFRDITTILKDAQKFKQAIEIITEKYREKKVDKVVAVEARGFIFGGIIAYKLKAGFVPVRKKGKLPAPVFEVTYELEYGTDTLQIHQDAILNKDKVLIVDDLLATGGTAKAVCELIAKFNAEIVGIEFLIELRDLKGREKLKDYPIYSIIKF